MKIQFCSSWKYRLLNRQSANQRIAVAVQEEGLDLVTGQHLFADRNAVSNRFHQLHNHHLATAIAGNDGFHLCGDVFQNERTIDNMCNKKTLAAVVADVVAIITLEKGWKVRLAAIVKREILKGNDKVIAETDPEFTKIVELFSRF